MGSFEGKWRNLGGNEEILGNSGGKTEKFWVKRGNFGGKRGNLGNYGVRWRKLGGSGEILGGSAEIWGETPKF